MLEYFLLHPLRDTHHFFYLNPNQIESQRDCRDNNGGGNHNRQQRRGRDGQRYEAHEGCFSCVSKIEVFPIQVRLDVTIRRHFSNKFLERLDLELELSLGKDEVSCMFNFTSILLAAYCQWTFVKNIQTQTESTEKQCTTLLYKKGPCKMFMKLSCGVNFTNILCTAKGSFCISNIAMLFGALQRAQF